MKSTATYQCRQCERPLERPFPSEAEASPCDGCAAPQRLDPTAMQDERLVHCPVCGLKVLYRQKDFRQAVGCAVVLVAAALVPFTLWHGIPLSLVAAAIIDFALYQMAGEVVICYRFDCRTHVRGVRPGPAVEPFDLSIHDYYRGIAQGRIEEPAGSRDLRDPG